MARTAPTRAGFLDSLPEDRRVALSTLDKVIRKAVPKLKPKIWPMMGRGLLGYGEFPYTFADGREGTWFIIGLASNKAYMSLYVSATDEKGYLVEQQLPKLGKVSGGRSCVNFKRLEDLNMPAVIALVKKAARMRGMLGKPVS